MKLRRLLATSTAVAIVASAMAVTSFADGAAFSSSVTASTNGSWAWDTVDLSMVDLIGNVDPAEVSKIVFAADEMVFVQYNTTKTDVETELYTKVELGAGKSVEITDMRLDDLYYFQLAMCTEGALTSNVTWEVYTAAAEGDDAPAVETPEAPEDTTPEDTTPEAPEATTPEDTAPEAPEATTPEDTTPDAPEVPTVENGTITIAEDTIGGDWGSEGFVSADILTQFTGDVTVTVDYATIVDGHDYWLIAPADYNGWAKLMVADITGDAGQQGDGFIKLNDSASNSISFTLTADQIAALADNAVVDAETGVSTGGLLFQIYGVDITSITVSDYVAPAAPSAPEGTTGTEGSTETGKGSPDTGVEGIAVAAGVVALAGAAVVASRKRK